MYLIFLNWQEKPAFAVVMIPPKGGWVVAGSRNASRGFTLDFNVPGNVLLF